MTPATIIQHAKAEGLELSLSQNGNIKAAGDSETVNRWLPIIREHKGNIIPLLAQQPAPMTATEAQAVRAWLASTNEPDPAEVERIFHLCQTDPITRGDVLHWASELPKPPAGQDDRRTCQQCANLLGERCAAAFRGELNADRRHEPIQNMPRRCEGFAPVASDPDQRPGRERWPELIQKGGE